MFRVLIIVFFGIVRGCPEKCTCGNEVICDGINLDLNRDLLDNKTRTLKVSNLNDSVLISHLTFVDCDLTNVSFDISTVKDFYLAGNNLEVIPEFANATNLRLLDLSHNSLVRLNSVGLLPNLELLNLSANSLISIASDSFANLLNLKCLDLSSNNLTRLDDKVLGSVKNLQYLNLSRNVLEVLDEVSFGALTKLRQLDVSWNRLARVAPGSLELPSLSRLLLAGNPQLEVLVGSVNRLQTLDASRTGLKQVPSALTHSIRTLRLAGNSITIVRCGDLDSYPLLQLLDFTANELTGIEDDALGRLETLSILYLTDNNIGNVPKSLPEHLTVLHLEHNRITTILSEDFQGLKTLEVLILSDNKITTISQTAFTQLTTLVALDLSRNPIKTLTPGSLQGPLQVLRLSSLAVKTAEKDGTFPLSNPEQLTTLDLSGSPFLARQYLNDMAALAASKNLQELDLSKTTLRTINPDILYYLPELRLLHLKNNEIDCQGLNWLANWMRSKDNPEYTEVQCSNPPELWGTPLVDLPAEATTKPEKPRKSVNRQLTTTTTITPTPSMAMYTKINNTHPGFYILGFSLLTILGFLFLVLWRFTKARKRVRERDIEVSSLPGVTELW